MANATERAPLKTSGRDAKGSRKSPPVAPQLATPTDLSADAVGPFPNSLRLTEAGDVILVPVHGHTPGQIAVLVEDADHTVLLAGDSSYTQRLMLRGAVDGVAPDEHAARLTHERIRAYAEANPTVYLVAHDPETATRLAERRIVDTHSVSVSGP